MTCTRAAILSMTLLVGACSSSDSPSDGANGGSGAPGESPGPITTPGEVVPGTLIEGVWESPCRAGEGMIGSRDLVLSVTDRVFEFIDSAYGDDSCDQDSALQVITTRGTFEELPIEDGREPADGLPIDLSVDMLFMKPLLSQVADELNAEARCGITNWVPDVDQDVSGCPTIEGSEAPRTDYNRYVVDDRGTSERADDTLVFGTLAPQPDPSRRPDGVDAQTLFTRRPGTV